MIFTFGYLSPYSQTIITCWWLYRSESFKTFYRSEDVSGGWRALHDDPSLCHLSASLLNLSWVSFDVLVGEAQLIKTWCHAKLSLCPPSEDKCGVASEHPWNASWEFKELWGPRGTMRFSCLRIWHFGPETRRQPWRYPGYSSILLTDGLQPSMRTPLSTPGSYLSVSISSVIICSGWIVSKSLSSAYLLIINFDSLPSFNPFCKQSREVMPYSQCSTLISFLLKSQYYHPHAVPSVKH